MSSLLGTLRRTLPLLAVLLVGAARPASAAPGVSVTMISSPNLTLDSNKPCLEGPRAAYVAYRLTNTSGGALTNLRATISGFASGITLGGGQAASQYVGTLAAGASRTLYWFVTYPCTFGNSATLTVSVTDDSPGATSGSGSVVTASMVSAQAGGVLMNATLGAGAVVGQIIEQDITYEFGGVSAGDSYNIQPVGNPGFLGSCFQLLKMQVVSSDVPAAPVGDTDRPYFAATANQGGSKHPLTVRFFFKYLCAGVTSTTRSYANQFSGGQLKYSSNYETFVGPTLPVASNPFTSTKTASPGALASSGTVTYTITVANPSAFAAEVDSIVDQLPAGMTYGGIAAGSGITAGNSGSVPAAGATGRLVWRGIPNSSYTLAGGGSLVLVYTASVSSAGQYVNSAQGYAGTTGLGAGPAADTVWVGSADVQVAKSGPATAAVQDTLVYVLTTSNAGPNTAYGVVVTDSLPAGVTFVSASRGGTHAGGVVTWPLIASLGLGASSVDSVKVTAPASLGTALNRGAASAGTIDPTAANNNGSLAGSQVSTTVTGPVRVTPDGGVVPQLQNGRYTQLFTVSNVSATTRTFDLLAGTAGATVFLTIDSIRGAGITTQPRPDSAQVTLGGGASQDYTVFYGVAAGDTLLNHESLTARPTTAAALLDSGWVSIRRVRPRVTLAKSVSPTGEISSGTELTYTLETSNVGEFAARSVAVTDSVPSEVAFKLGSAGQTLPTGVTVTVAYSSDEGVTWSYLPVSGGCGAPAGFDACVRRLRWSFDADLPAGASASAATFSFAARIK